MCVDHFCGREGGIARDVERQMRAVRLRCGIRNQVVFFLASRWAAMAVKKSARLLIEMFVVVHVPSFSIELDSATTYNLYT
jgi:hypothetical protein